MSAFLEPKFFVKSGDMGFVNRQKDIFEQLNAMEKEKNERQLNEVLDHQESVGGEVMEVSVAVMRPRKRLRSETKQFRGKESIFKRPEALPPRFNSRNIPDYQRHPHRWTKYSLGDISQEDMSERSNTAAAFSFLRELESRKSTQYIEEDRNTSKKVIFKSINKVDHSNGGEEVSSSPDGAKSSFKSTKLIMPEYVIGQKIKKTATKKIKLSSLKPETSDKSVKLSHLEEEEEDNEMDDK